MNRTLIITGGSIDYDFASLYLNKNKFNNVIAVDGGIAPMEKLKLYPTHIIGDFDTIAPAFVEKYKNSNQVTCIELQPEKDQTDTQEAMELAIRIESDDIVMLGAFGSRLDHTLANVSLLEMALKKEISACLLDKNNKIYLINHDIELLKKDLHGQFVSLLPFTDLVLGVDLIGFAYPLEKYEFSRYSSYGIGISNEIIGERALIKLEEGILIVIEAQD